MENDYDIISDMIDIYERDFIEKNYINNSFNFDTPKLNDTGTSIDIKGLSDQQ